MVNILSLNWPIGPKQEGSESEGKVGVYKSRFVSCLAGSSFLQPCLAMSYFLAPDLAQALPCPALTTAGGCEYVDRIPCD